MKKLFVTILMFSLAKINAQLSGSATLNGQSNHSGITVKFIPASATSVSDSVLTSSTGTFAINVSGGLYKIEFSKAGYQTAYYGNNATVLLTNTTVLTVVNLYAGTVSSVGGNVSGTWYNSTIYVVNSNITVPSGSTLTIQPGTVVKFNATYSLTVYGILNATGTSSQKIVFTSNHASPVAGSWKGLYLFSTQSVIKNCLLEYAENAISIDQSSPAIEDNEIRRFSGSAIALNMNSSSLIKNNTIHDYTINPYGFGINSYQCNAKIECNSIYDGNGRGISVGDGSSIKNNHIYNIGGTERGYGLDLYYIASSRVENNIIHNCDIGITYGENVSPGPNPLIINNTIYATKTGIIDRGFYGAGSIIGNIIVNNENGIMQGYAQATPTDISYNLVWNSTYSNYYDVQTQGIGQNVNTNANGDPIDSYFNVSKDPLFVNNTPPYYSSGSPCVNAGKAMYSSNIGANPAAMCEGMILGVKENATKKVGVYPNPFSSYLVVNGVESSKVNSAKFYDMAGKSFEAHIENRSANGLKILNPDLAKGIYFLEISFSDSSKEYLRLIKE